MKKNIFIPIVILLAFIISPYSNYKVHAADTTPPTVSLTSPSAGTISGSVTVTASASDNVGVTSVQFKLDGSDIGGAILSPYTYTWDTTYYSNGTHTLTAVAEDAAGNVTTSSGVSVTISNSTPTVTGTTYYIASSGSTSNSGTSSSSPWPLSKVGSTSFVAGDQILFHKGDTFTGTISFSRSGSAGHPIVFDVYGTATNNPVIDANASTSPALSISSNYVTVNNLVIQNSKAGSGVVYLATGTHDITFYNDYINSGIRGIDAFHSGSSGVANIKILHSYFSNISDVSGNVNGGGSCIQLNNVNGSGVELAYNNCYVVNVVGQSLTPNVGDILSVYQSNGTSTSPILVYGNNVRGGGSEAPSDGKAGLVLGDVTGSYQYGWDNVFVNPGAVGAQVQGGNNINMSDNLIYSAKFPYTSVGLAYGNYSGVSSYSVTMERNKINFTTLSGSIFNKWWDTNTVSQPTGWTTNTADSVADSSVTNSLLSDPLWSGSPWNTTSSGGGDTTAPTVSITAPSNGATISGSSVSLTASASDNVGVSSVQFVIDGSLVGSPDTSAPYSYTLDSTALSNGTHTISAVAKDAANNSGTSSVVSVTVSNSVADTTAPTVSVTAPSNGSTISGSSVSLTASASDNVGVASVQFKVDGSNVGSADTVAPYSYTLDSTTLSNGTHTISAVAKDAANNSTTSTGVSVTVDNAAPVISNVAVSNITQTGASFSWTTDKIASTEVVYGLTSSYGSTSGFVSTQVTSHSATLSGLTAGTTYHYTVVSIGANNVLSYSPDTTFTTASAGDTTAPTVSVTAPTNGATVSGSSVSLTASASDNVGVASVQFVIDGSLVGSPDTTAPYSYTWNTTGVSNGTHTISAVAKDAANNSGTSSVVSVTVSNSVADTTAPTVSITAPSNGATISGSSVSLTASASDNVGVSSVQFVIDGSLVGSPDTSAPYSYTLDSTALSNGTHTISAVAKDAANNSGTSSVVSVTVSNSVATNPVISSVVASPSQTTATITFLTDLQTSNQIQYGTTTSYGASAWSSSLLTTHTITLSGLTENTTYHYRIISTTAGSLSTTSSDYTFTTSAAPDVNPAVISSVSSGSLSSTGATVTWTTDKVASSQVEYGTTTGYGSTTTFDSAQVTSHSVVLTGLTAGTTYHYRVKSVAANNVLATSQDYTLTTSSVSNTGGPVISNIVVSNITQTGATFTWTTDKTGTTQVVFGPTSSYGQNSPYVNTQVTSHSATLSGLTAGTTYHYSVVSIGTNSILSYSPDTTFTTASAISTSGGGGGGGAVTSSNGPVINSIAVTAVSPTAATITFVTDQIASSIIAYGTTTSYSDGTLYSTSYLTTHTVYFSGLTAGTTYHYHITNSNPNGQSSISSDYTFTTTGTSDSSTTSASSSSSSSSTTIPDGCTVFTHFSPLNGQPCPNYNDSASIDTIISDLGFGTRSDEVKTLQHVLNLLGYTVAPSGYGSLNNETTYYGPATQAAVQKFQTAQGIVPATGTVQQTTRTVINKLIDGKLVTTTPNADGVEHAVVTVQNLNVRSGSSTKYPVITTVPNGTVGTVMIDNGSWLQVSFPNSITGWVSHIGVTVY